VYCYRLACMIIFERSSLSPTSLGLDKLRSSVWYLGMLEASAFPNLGTPCLPTRRLVGLPIAFLTSCNPSSSSCWGACLRMHSFLMTSTPFFSRFPPGFLPFRSWPSAFKSRPRCFLALLLSSLPGDFLQGDAGSAWKGLTVPEIFGARFLPRDSELLLGAGISA